MRHKKDYDENEFPLINPQDDLHYFKNLIQNLHPGMKHVPDDKKLPFFLSTLARVGAKRFVQACRAIRVPLRAVKQWRKDIPEFNEACEEAEAAYVASLWEAVHERAVDGLDTDAYTDGVRDPSDGLMMKKYDNKLLEFALKAHDPTLKEKDAPTVQIGINSPGNGVLVVPAPFPQGQKGEEQWLEHAREMAKKPLLPGPDIEKDKDRHSE